MMKGNSSVNRTMIRTVQTVLLLGLVKLSAGAGSHLNTQQLKKLQTDKINTWAHGLPPKDIPWQCRVKLCTYQKAPGREFCCTGCRRYPLITLTMLSVYHRYVDEHGRISTQTPQKHSSWCAMKLTNTQAPPPVSTWQPSSSSQQHGSTHTLQGIHHTGQKQNLMFAKQASHQNQPPAAVTNRVKCNNSEYKCTELAHGLFGGYCCWNCKLLADHNMYHDRNGTWVQKGYHDTKKSLLARAHQDFIRRTMCTLCKGKGKKGMFSKCKECKGTGVKGTENQLCTKFKTTNADLKHKCRNKCGNTVHKNETDPANGYCCWACKSGNNFHTDSEHASDQNNVCTYYSKANIYQ